MTLPLINKKSQAAVEYLQNYGFAILIVLILGVALWKIGVFNIAPKANVAVGFKTIKVLEPSIRYKGTAGLLSQYEAVTNNLNFTIVNTGGNYIHDLTLIVGGDCNYSITSAGTTLCSGTSFEKTILGPSETTSVGHICCYSYSRGDPFWVEINITYSERIGGRKVQKSEHGIIKGFVE